MEDQVPTSGTCTCLWRHVCIFTQVSLICRLTFYRPVDRSRSISTIDKDLPTWKFGRYRQLIRIHLLENTVNIDGGCQFTYLKIRSISHRPSIWAKNWSKSTVDVKSYQKNNRLITTVDVPSYQKNQLMVDIDRRSGHGLKKIVNIDLTHPYFITNKCIWLTRTLTSVHPDPFQALLTKQHSTKKPTHTNKVYDGHRVAHPPSLLGATSHLRFHVWRFKRLAFGPGRVFARSQDHLWSRMVP